MSGMESSQDLWVFVMVWIGYVWLGNHSGIVDD
jgi:hypothetical protein